MLAIAGAMVGTTAATADDAGLLTVSVAPRVVRNQTVTVELQGVAAEPGWLTWVIRPAQHGPCQELQVNDPSSHGTTQNDIWGTGDHHVAAGRYDLKMTRVVKGYLRSGAYVLCAWLEDTQFNTLATGTAPTRVVRPQLRLHVAPPAHARAGTPSSFLASGHVDTRADLRYAIVPARLARGCPATEKALEGLGARTRTTHVKGDFRLRGRLKTTSPGTYHFCGYAAEYAPNAPDADLATAKSFATFRVR